MYLRQIAKKQHEDLEFVKIAEMVKKGEINEFHFDEKGVLRYGNKLWIPNDIQLKGEIMREAHNTRYNVHLRAIKMYQDLKKVY